MNECHWYGLWTMMAKRDQYFDMDSEDRFMEIMLEGRLPITDGDEGADIYGYAASGEAAMAVARELFVDEVSHAEQRGPVTLRTGEVLGKAWVVFTVPCAEAVAAN